jgi:alpha-L-rhamnosidase
MELLRALHAAGLDAHMVDVLTDPTGPGWAHILAAGGTFTWEDWAPSDLDGDSMSHGWGSSALVAMQEALLGVTFLPPGAGGSPVLGVRPPVSALTHAAGAVPTAAGPVHLAWRRGARAMTVALTLPANAEAEVTLAAPPGAVTEGGAPLGRAAGVTVLTGGPPGVTALSVGGGSYRFVAALT